MNGLDCGVYVGCATLGGIEPDIPAFGPFTNIGGALGASCCAQARAEYFA